MVTEVIGDEEVCENNLIGWFKMEYEGLACSHQPHSLLYCIICHKINCLHRSVSIRLKCLFGTHVGIRRQEPGVAVSKEKRNEMKPFCQDDGVHKDPDSCDKSVAVVTNLDEQKSAAHSVNLEMNYNYLEDDLQHGLVPVHAVMPGRVGGQEQDEEGEHSGHQGQVAEIFVHFVTFSLNEEFKAIKVSTFVFTVFALRETFRLLATEFPDCHLHTIKLKLVMAYLVFLPNDAPITRVQRGWTKQTKFSVKGKYSAFLHRTAHSCSGLQTPEDEKPLLVVAGLVYEHPTVAAVEPNSTNKRLASEVEIREPQVSLEVHGSLPPAPAAAVTHPEVLVPPEEANPKVNLRMGFNVDVLDVSDMEVVFHHKILRELAGNDHGGIPPGLDNADQVLTRHVPDVEGKEVVRRDLEPGAHVRTLGEQVEVVPASGGGAQDRHQDQPLDQHNQTSYDSLPIAGSIQYLNSKIT